MSTLRRYSAAALLIPTIAAGLVAAAPAAQAGTSSAKCASVVVITARGTNAPAGNGQFTALTKLIQQKSKKGVRVTALSYPATAIAPIYPISVARGEDALRSELQDLASKCSSTKTVLIGYSQGAHVIGDTLDNDGTQLTARAAANIEAVVFYGDPTFRAGQSYDRGTYSSKHNGIFARSKNDLSKFNARIASYCDAGDEFCQGGDNKSVHGGYFKKYNTAAANWVVGRTG